MTLGKRYLGDDLTLVVGLSKGKAAGSRGVLSPPFGFTPVTIRTERPSPKRFLLQEPHAPKETREGGNIGLFWKPEVSVLVLVDQSTYGGFDEVPPFFLVDGEAGKYFPVVLPNTLSLKSENYIEITENTTVLPLTVRIEPASLTRILWIMKFEAKVKRINEQREQQMQDGSPNLALTNEDLDSVRDILFNTNPILFYVTVAVSFVHVLLDFLAFKNDISFWKSRKDNLEGISMNSVLCNALSEVVIFLFLYDNNTSLLVLAPAGISVVVDFWKLTKAFELKWPSKAASTTTENVKNENKSKKKGGEKGKGKGKGKGKEKEEPAKKEKGKGETISKEVKQNFWERCGLPTIGVKDAYKGSPTSEYDQGAFFLLLKFLLPVIIGYCCYTLVWEPQKGWYSWALKSLTSLVYGLGFLMMTPQLFINYKLKTVAHLPWRALIYKASNTFIDDLFAFIISMPMLHRISCFRDDIVFIIYMYQRFIYPVDEKRKEDTEN